MGVKENILLNKIIVIIILWWHDIHVIFLHLNVGINDSIYIYIL